MIELILIANLVVLLLIFLMIRTWFPLLKKKTSYLSHSDSRKKIEVIITIPQSTHIQEEYSILPVGLSKKFENSVIVETFDSFEKIQESKFHHATLSISSFVHAFDLIMDEGAFIINIRYFEEKIGMAHIEIMCDQHAYEFLKQKNQSNSILSLSIENAEKFEPHGLEDFVIKGKK